MRIIGEICLLTAFVGSGFAAFACLSNARSGRRALEVWGRIASLAGFAALTALIALLAWALVTKDFSYNYVAQYTSRHLPWYYSLSALWVGQAGSLLLWAWFMGLLAVLFRFARTVTSDPTREVAFGLLMGYVCFLLAIMSFAANPMAANVVGGTEGAGLNPSLQHPAMLIHPPVVFLGYALWTVPFALAVAALLTGRLDATWVLAARPWALMAWLVLGVGILLGGAWAYEELGWGGYWGWDPVENGSLMPWLTGTALIHTMMIWQNRRALKKTTIVLVIVTFGLCNFATFLTRSGVFSSLHAFSESPIGWLFLALMFALVASGVLFLVLRRDQLAPDKPIRSVLSREGFVLISTTALVSLTVVVLAGTISTALSKYIYGRTIMVGPTFYNNVLVPIGLVLLLTTAAAPLLRWGQGPTADQKKYLFLSAGAGLLAVVTAWLCSSWHPMTMAVLGSSIMALTALGCSLVLDAGRRAPEHPARGLLSALGAARRQYAGFLIHLSFFCVAIGVAGSSLGTRQQDVTLSVGDTVQWAGCSVRLARVNHLTFPDKLVAEAELNITRADGRKATILPAQHFHRLNQAWTTEVGIDSTWRGDFYVILHSGEGSDQVELTLIDNPMMRWLWMGGWIAGVGALIRLWPRRGSAAVAASSVSGRRTDSTAARRAMAASLLIACILNGTAPVSPCGGTAPNAATADQTTD